jgi:hypothetical protein
MKAVGALQTQSLLMFKAAFAMLLLCALSTTHAQQKILPAWKPGDAWAVKSVMTTPSSSLSKDASGIFYLDTIFQEFIWKVERETEEHFILSLKMISYETHFHEAQRIFDDEMTSLYKGLKEQPAILYRANKDGTITTSDEEEPEEGESSFWTKILAFKPHPLFLNNSVLYKHVSDWEEERFSRYKKLEESGEPLPQLVEIIHLDKNEREAGHPSTSIDESALSIELDSSPFSDTENAWMTNQVYIDKLQKTLSERIEMLHEHFGVEIKQMGIPYEVDSVRDADVAALQLNNLAKLIYKITGTYHFEDQGDFVSYTSNIDLEMKESLQKIWYSEDPPIKKPKKTKSTSDFSLKASEELFSLLKTVMSYRLLDRHTFTPMRRAIIYRIRLSNDFVEVNEQINFEKTE